MLDKANQIQARKLICFCPVELGCFLEERPTMALVCGIADIGRVGLEIGTLLGAVG